MGRISPFDSGNDNTQPVLDHLSCALQLPDPCYQTCRIGSRHPAFSHHSIPSRCERAASRFYKTHR
jgi:hypothetical protein